ncbi:MAG: sodium:calcium antiporter [Candidatus Bathyarchaeota archaeon]|nr:sodium:calcium antiporter [Candidatus Bathyarchaeota archaeon]
MLISGIFLLTFSSDKAVEHSVHFASTLGISSLMIGLILVSIGTDLPEIANSIVACSSGHGDIDVGDSIGSVLTQITLILGLIPFLGRKFKVKRREVLVIGAFEVLALILAISVVLTGFTRVKAFLLIASWPIFLLVIKKTTAKDIVKKKQLKTQTGRHYLIHLVIAALSYVGVAVGALAVVQSVISMSNELGVPEFFISFFVLAIGTSLPELVVDLTAIRKRQYELAIGDIIGSCIVDATVSISIGQLFFPTAVFVGSPERSILLALYAILASAVVILTLALREKVDRRAGGLFIILYLISYTLLYAV